MQRRLSKLYVGTEESHILAAIIDLVRNGPETLVDWNIAANKLIAAALGSRVYTGPAKEVGFAPVILTGAGAASPLRHVADVPVLHWHGDTFDLPPGAERLAETGAYANQAFRIGDFLLALQFHPEMGEDPRFAEWLENKDYIHAAGTDPQALAADHDRLGSAAVEAGRRLLAEWLAQLPDYYD